MQTLSPDHSLRKGLAQTRHRRCFDFSLARGSAGEPQPSSIFLRSSISKAHYFQARTLPKNVDDAAALVEMDELLPGFSATLEADGSAMHQSDTLDLVYVISGKCDLEVDDGAKVAVAEGDVVVQNGTRHAWLNPYDKPCRLLGVNFGAHRTR